MSENETGVKRSLEEETHITEEQEHKKQKLDEQVGNEEPKLKNNTITEANNDTIMQETDTQKDKVAKETDKANNSQDMEQEMVSADLSKPVTQIPDTEKAPTSLEDASITSEQLLMALTSIHSADLLNTEQTTTTTTAAVPVEATAETVEETTATVTKEHAQDTSTATAITAEEQLKNTITAAAIMTEEKVEDTAATTATITVDEKMEEASVEEKQVEDTEMAENPPRVQEPAKVDVPTTSETTLPTITEPVKPSPPPTVNPVEMTPPPTGLGITPKDDSSPIVLPASQPSTSTHVGSPLKNVSSAVSSSPLKFSNTTDSSLSATLSAAPNISISNLPDIKAALRRLSSANVSASSVIEQLSTAERKASDVSPSEILGNALAAVAATAARSNNNTPSPQASSSNTAIGNLAAITANISNLLHSGGFHRNNSFSQEEEQQRRKSSIALVGNAFTNMMDMIGNRKPVKPKLIVKNEQVFKAVEGVEETHLGFQLYSPHLLLPNLENKVNGVMEVRVPARFLTFDNEQVQKCAVWGTDIYTDDSDIVAMIIHAGKYVPTFVEPVVEANDPFVLEVAGKHKEAVEATKKLAMSGRQYIRRYEHLIPDHDLKVTVRVLPKLQHYASSIRHKLKSREWHQHDGMSLYVDKVEKVKRGDAKLKGRSSLKSNMFAYETYRKKALGITPTTTQKKKQSTANNNNNELSPHTTTTQRGRVKKSSRVLRMFKIHSELKKNS